MKICHTLLVTRLHSSVSRSIILHTCKEQTSFVSGFGRWRRRRWSRWHGRQGRRGIWRRGRRWGRRRRRRVNIWACRAEGFPILQHAAFSILGARPLLAYFWWDVKCSAQRNLMKRFFICMKWKINAYNHHPSRDAIDLVRQIRRTLLRTYLSLEYRLPLRMWPECEKCQLLSYGE